jgi:hypothetical protein
MLQPLVISVLFIVPAQLREMASETCGLLNLNVYLGFDFQVNLWFGGFYSGDA